jgi:tripartite-type tricarboxylate transporter receptor subunit TctC
MPLVFRPISAITLTFLLGLIGFATPLAAADNEMFRGKTITYIVSTSAGGIYDAQSRLLARFLQTQLPGARILVRNVPGAGHIIGANTIYASRPDGLTIGTFNTGLIYAQMLERPGIRFDLSKMSYIAKATSDTRALLVSKNSNLSTIEDLFVSETPIMFAAAGVGSAAYIETRILQDALNLPLQLVPGFDGTEAELSMLRGEVAAQVGTATSLQPFVDNGNGHFVLILSDSDAYAGVPRADDYAQDDRGRELLALISTLSHIGRLTAGPPGLAPETLRVLRDAVIAAMSDPGYIAEGERLGLPMDPAPGDRVEVMVKQALAQSPEMIALLKIAAREQ